MDGYGARSANNFNGSVSPNVTHTVTVPVVQFATPAYAITDHLATVTVTLNLTPMLTATVEYTTRTDLSDTLVFSPSVIFQTFTLTVTNDAPVTVTLTNPTNAIVGERKTIVVALLRYIYLPLIMR